MAANIINNSMNYYVNPNTNALTSNHANTAIYDKEKFNAAMNRLLDPIVPLVDLSKTPLKLADRMTINKSANSINIVDGQKIKVNDDYILTVKPQGVEVSGGYKNPYDTEAFETAQRMASSLTQMLMNASGLTYKKAYNESYNEGVKDVMSYLGIDTTKRFTVNGMNFSINQDGNYVSEADKAVKEAYERMVANNRTYNLSDEKTRNHIDYISNYYLRTVPENIKEKWTETLEETNINPFQYDFGSTLATLSMEQDFETGGSDNIFGDTIESFRDAVNMILERINKPLGNMTEKRKVFLQQEKIFYTKLSEKISSL